MKMKNILIVALFAFSASSYSQNEELYERTASTSTTACGGVERWSVKVLTDAAASTVNLTGSVTP